MEDVFKYIVSEEANYKTAKVPVIDGYEWNMFEHIKLSTLQKNSQFETGNPNGEKPFKNITRPILNVHYRAEGFDLKDIEAFVDDVEQFHKSFLVRYYHNRWGRKYDIDTFIDELVESYVDYGGAIVKNVNEVRPEVVPLQRIAFCDQTDILSGPICEKHMYSIDQLLDMKGKWDSDEIDLVINTSRSEKKVAQANDQVAKTPGKYIEVYELHGVFPEKWLGKGYEDSEEYCRQIHIITFTNKDDRENKGGVYLFKGKEKKQIYKVLLRDTIYGRALGLGGIEELFDAQIWTNYSLITIKEMLDQASKIIYQTASASASSRNNTRNMDNGEIIDNGGEVITRLDNQPFNMTAFDKSAMEWEQYARMAMSANDAVLGVSPTSGTPFKLQDLVRSENYGIHEYRQGKIAKFMDEIYRDWTIEHLVREMQSGDRWLEELSFDDLQWVAERLATNESNRRIKDGMMKGKLTKKKEQEMLRQMLKEEFMNGGSDKFVEIFEKEMKDAPVAVRMNIAGKQKDLNKMADKLTNIFRQIFANPQGFKETMMIPGAAKSFNGLLEASGLNQMDFSGVAEAPVENQLATVN